MFQNTPYGSWQTVGLAVVAKPLPSRLPVSVLPAYARANKRLFLPLLPIQQQQFSLFCPQIRFYTDWLGSPWHPTSTVNIHVPKLSVFCCLPLCCFLTALPPWDCHLSPGWLSFPPYTTRQCLVSRLWVISPLGSRVSSQSLLLVLIPRGSNTGLVRLAGSWLFIFLVPSCKKSGDGSHMCAFSQRNRTTSQCQLVL